MKKHNTAIAFGLFTSLIMGIGCAGEGTNVSSGASDAVSGDDSSYSDTGDSDVDEEGEEVAKADCVTRADAKTWLTVHNGLYGTEPGCYSYCPAGSYVYRVALKSEGTQGGGDDTALNGIRFDCYTKAAGASTGFITSKEGLYGGNYLAAAPTGGINKLLPLTTAQMKYEGSQGAGDDSAANLLVVRQKGSAIDITPAANTNWGSLQARVACPTGQAICGMKTQVEDHQGGDFDDTSLNGLKIACCTF